MENSEKVLLMGLGFITGGLIILINIKRGIFPKERTKRQWVVATLSFVLGVILIIASFLIK